MKRIVLSFLMCAFFFVIHKNQVIGYVVAQEESDFVILRQGAQAVQNATETQEEKAAKDAQEKGKKEVENELSKLKQSCDFPGAQCCVGKPPVEIPDSLSSKVINPDKLPKADDSNDPLSPVWCDYIPEKRLLLQYGSNKSVSIFRHLIPSSLDPSNCTCEQATTSLEKICASGVSSNEQGACADCIANKKGVWTALGCVESTLGGFVKNTLLGWGIGLAGVVAMLCIIYSAFMMQISSGNPEKIKKAKERLTACIVGLLLIIFSVFILKLIGVDILQIPGFL